ncbi:phage Gp37/Gp68 family protein [Methylobacterium sp. E-045]|uniref:phage Gp37/Gp68 family protein n=1 Tax=Methylobacterium sp. E-045 TaxID=2836575 RepID=UPI001FBA55A2|nr:phage Gp37/Gp68 family protein [Methylobacterium sp. E-045]MCJ2128325.1 phage Gp37/Gp68 family protein [Methylobacterium sp. E-045]
MSKIEWTEKTWNPIVGCSVVSPGCTNCYAMTMAARLERMGTERYRGLTKPSKAGAVWTGETRLVEETLTEPLRRRKPTMWFVNSMSDLFHESAPDAWIDRVFAVMALCPQHTFQVLTKRSARMRAYLSSDETAGRLTRALSHGIDGIGSLSIVSCHDGLSGFQLPNVWLGVSTEDQRRADERVPDLLATPAAVRFVSAEPLLGPIDFRNIPYPSPPEDEGRRGSALDGHEVAGLVGNCIAYIPALDWIIVGGESGPGARPMHPAWARSIRDQCARAGVPYFFKQWGAWSEDTNQDSPRGDYIGAHPGVEPIQCCDTVYMAPVGKKVAGRLLDGVEHNGMPEVRT